MPALRLIVDMSLPPAWVEVLQGAGIEARDAIERGALVTVDDARARVRLLPIGQIEN